MITSTIATAMTIPASIATLRFGPPLLHGDSVSPPLLANARNSAVLREESPNAESPAAAGKSVSRSDMGMTIADHGLENGPVSLDLRETGRYRTLPCPPAPPSR